MVKKVSKTQVKKITKNPPTKKKGKGPAMTPEEEELYKAGKKIPINIATVRPANVLELVGHIKKPVVQKVEKKLTKEPVVIKRIRHSFSPSVL